MLASVNGANIAKDVSSKRARRMSAFCEGGNELLRTIVREMVIVVDFCIL